MEMLSLNQDQSLKLRGSMEMAQAKTLVREIEPVFRSGVVSSDRTRKYHEHFIAQWLCWGQRRFLLRVYQVSPERHSVP